MDLNKHNIELELVAEKITAGNMSSWANCLPIIKKIMELDVSESIIEKLKNIEGEISDRIMSGNADSESAEFIQDLIFQFVSDSKIENINSQNLEEKNNTDEKWLKIFSENLAKPLEDFEEQILRIESGELDYWEEIRQFLHNLKGELSFLGFEKYSNKIHLAESLIANNSMSIDVLLLLKDELYQFLKDPNFALEIKSEFIEGAGDENGDDDINDANEPEIYPTCELKFDKEHILGEPDFFVDFVHESKEHIQNVEVHLLELESNPLADESIQNIFRAAHTIKGLAGFLELKEIQSLSHSMEALMDLARNGKITLNSLHIDVLLDAVDVLKELILCLEELLANKLRAMPTNYFVVMTMLKKALNSYKPNLVLTAGGAKTGEILIANSKIKKEDIDSALSKQEAGDKRRIGEILIREQGVSAREVGKALSIQNKSKEQTPHCHSQSNVQESVRVPVQKLDQLIDAIGEAVIAQSMIVGDRVLSGFDEEITKADRDSLRHKVARAELIMRQIQNYSMSLRMVSVKLVFQKMSRLVRDLAKKLDKDVDLILEGENTELDKTVVEKIADPLVHMLRNSLDHGLETKSERIATNKSVNSFIKLKAYHKAGSVIIEIQDDGRGLNREKILNKAIEKKLLSANSNPSDAEVWQQIFKPGFSTAEVVTDVSGRGVGMDVVRKNIEALHGAIDISSTAGVGTLFTIKLPLTLAIIDGMLIKVNNERYIFPILSIHTTVRPEPKEFKTMQGQGEFLNIKGELIKLIRLKNILKSNKTDSTKDNEGVVLIVLDSTGKKVGLLVDEILGQQQVVVKGLGAMGTIPGITGGAIMNDGVIALIIDVSGIIRISNEVMND